MYASYIPKEKRNSSKKKKGKENQLGKVVLKCHIDERYYRSHCALCNHRHSQDLHD